MKTNQLQAFLLSGLFCSSAALVAGFKDSLATSTDTRLLLSLAKESKAEASISTGLADTFMTAAAAIANVEAAMDTDIDLRTDIALDTNRSGGAPVSNSGGDSGPATLAEYCAGPTAEEEANEGVKEGTKVNANWEGYGTMYPGKVTDENRDGTIDIKYDDGFTEKRVKKDDFKVVDKEKKQKAGKSESLMMTSIRRTKKLAAARDDAACKLQDFLKKLQDQLKNLNKMTSQWVAGQRAKIAGDKTPPAPPKVLPAALGAPPAAAPPAAPAVVSEDESDELEKLKEKLAEREEYVKELEKQAKENDEALQKLSPTTAAPSAGVSAIDDLIAQYKAKLADRDTRIKELLELIRMQEEELARLGADQLSLKDIDDAVQALEQDVEEAKAKRDELEKDGSLDPELRAVIDAIIKSLEKMRNKIDNLIALEAKAKADREKAEREADEAAEAARKKAKEEGKDADEAAAEAKAKAEKEAREQVKKADLESMKAAQEVSKDLEEAEEGATQLDTGLHPHGAKWWRYRYEHSHIEALVMIFISTLMLVWSVLIRKLTENVDVWALGPGEKVKTELEEISAETHGTVYVVWLHLLAEQMMVCILVFLTVWLIAKTHLCNLFPLIIAPEDIRVPTTGEEYRHLCVDVCTIFFFAIMFYFSLIFAVAHQTSRVTERLEKFERESTPAKLRRSSTGAVSAQAMGAIATTSDDFEIVKKHFAKHMNKDVAESSDGSLEKQISKHIGGNFANFPLWMYLKYSIRSSVAQLFHFGWAMWAPVICLFITLMCLHRFAHMGYVRIMGFFGLVTLAVIVGIGRYTKTMSQEIHAQKDAEPGPKKWSIHNAYPTQVIFLGFLQFAMFTVCYGVARMICQPWMWELHFWPVLILTLVAIFSSFLFVWLVAPAIPSFCAMSAIPPYTDHDDLETMLHIAQKSSAA